MKKGGDKEERSKKYRLLDDEQVEELDLNSDFCLKHILPGDKIEVEIGENVFFVKDVITKILQGPYKFLDSIRFSATGNQEMSLRFMSEGQFQILFTGQIGEEIFQLFEAFLDAQKDKIHQFEFVYEFSIDLSYNERILNKFAEIIQTQSELRNLINQSNCLLKKDSDQQEKNEPIQKSNYKEMNRQNGSNKDQNIQINKQKQDEQKRIYLIHVSVIILGGDMQWRGQLVRSLGLLQGCENVCLCLRENISEEELIMILKGTEVSKCLVLQAQNLVIVTKESPSHLASARQSNLGESARKLLLPSFVRSKSLRMDISFVKRSFSPQLEIIHMKSFWTYLCQRAKECVSIQLKFASVVQLSTLVPKILSALEQVNQTLELASPEITLKYDLLSKKLLIHFKEEQMESDLAKHPEDTPFQTGLYDSSSKRNEQGQNSRSEWGFVQSFVNHFRGGSGMVSLHVILENVSFRHNSRFLYGQMIDFSKMSHRISNFKLEAPIELIKQDFTVQKMWKSQLESLILVSLKRDTSRQRNVLPKSVLTKSVVTKSVVTQSVVTQSVVPQQAFTQSINTQPAVTQSVLTQSLVVVTQSLDWFKPFNAVFRFRKLQFDCLISEFAVEDQSFHLSCLLERNQANSDQSKIKNALNQFLSEDAREQNVKWMKEKYDQIENNSKDSKHFYSFDRQNYIPQNQGFNRIIIFSYGQNSTEKCISLRIDAKEIGGDIVKQIIKIRDLSRVHRLSIRLPENGRDNYVGELLKFLSNSTILRQMSLELYSSGVSENTLRLLHRFVSSNVTQLQEISISVAGNLKGDIDRQGMQHILSLLPFKESPRKLLRGTFQFKKLDSLENVSTMVDAFHYVASEQTVRLLTSTFDLSKDECNKFHLRVNAYHSASTTLFHHFIQLQSLYSQDFNEEDAKTISQNANQPQKTNLQGSLKTDSTFIGGGEGRGDANIGVQIEKNNKINQNGGFITARQDRGFMDRKLGFECVDVILSELQYSSFFRFLEVYSGQISTLRVQFLNLSLDRNKLETLGGFTNVLGDISSMSQVEMSFRDEWSKEDVYSLKWVRNKRSLSIYYQGNQVFSSDYNYERLMNATLTELKGLFEFEIEQLHLELYFDSHQRYLACAHNIHLLKTFLLKNTSNLRKLHCTVKVQVEKGCFETHHIFDEIERVVNLKDYLLTKYVLLCRTLVRTQIKNYFRKEILWDTVSLLIFGKARTHLQPILQSLFQGEKLLNNSFNQNYTDQINHSPLTPYNKLTQNAIQMQQPLSSHISNMFLTNNDRKQDDLFDIEFEN